MHLPRDGTVQVRDVTDQLRASASGAPTRAVSYRLSRRATGRTPPSLTCRRERSRSGAAVGAQRVTYVGELGWELYVENGRAAAVGSAPAGAGRPLGLEPVGYKAVDSLRLEKGYRYWSTDLTPAENPYEAGLAFCVRLQKGDFVGREALLRIKAEGVQREALHDHLDGADGRRLRPVRRRGRVRRRPRDRAPAERGLGLHGRQAHRLRLSAASLSATGTPLEVEAFGARASRPRWLRMCSTTRPESGFAFELRLSCRIAGLESSAPRNRLGPRSDGRARFKPASWPHVLRPAATVVVIVSVSWRPRRRLPRKPSTIRARADASDCRGGAREEVSSPPARRQREAARLGRTRARHTTPPPTRSSRSAFSTFSGERVSGPRAPGERRLRAMVGQRQSGWDDDTGPNYITRTSGPPTTSARRERGFDRIDSFLHSTLASALYEFGVEAPSSGPSYRLDRHLRRGRAARRALIRAHCELDPAQARAQVVRPRWPHRHRPYSVR